MAKGWKGETMGYSKEAIHKAEEVSIVDYVDVTGVGDFYYRKGKQYKLSINGSDSVVVDTQKNLFYHNSTGTSGNIIKFIQYFEGETFPKAVEKLLQFRREGKVAVQEKELEAPKEPFEYTIEHNPTTYRVVQYLVKERGISKAIVSQLLEKGLLHEDSYGNAVFDWSDNGLPEGKRVGATKQGTYQRYDADGNPLPKKYIEKNSELLGFNVTLGEPKELYIFEAPIDLLSYWTLHPDLENVRLYAMDGVKMNAAYAFLVNTITHFGGKPEAIYVGTDNDKAGSLFYEEAKVVFELYTEKFESIVPQRYEVLRGVYPLYEKISQETAVEIPLLISIHKHENGGQLNTIAFHKNTTSFFTTSDPKDKSSYSLEVFEERLRACAKQLSGKNTEEILKQYYSDRTLERSVKDFYEYYQSHEILTVPEYQKDWNDLLKNKPIATPVKKENNQEVDQERSSAFEYPYQETKKEAVRDFYYQQHIAPEIIEHLMDKRLLRSDEAGNPVFAFRRYKQTVGASKWNPETGKLERLENSLQHNTFSVSLGNPQTVIAFEDSHQLLRFWTLHKGTLNHVHLVSLEGLDLEQKRTCLVDRLTLLKQVESIYLCREKTLSGEKLQAELEELPEIKKKGKLKILQPLLGNTWAEDLRKTKNDYLELARTKPKERHRGAELSL